MENINNALDESEIEETHKPKANFKTSISRLYYNIISSQFSMDVFYILLLFIEAIQINGLIMFHIFYSNTQSNYTAIKTIIDVLKIIYTLYPPGNMLVSSIIMYILIIILLSKFILFIYFTRNDINYKTTQRYMVILILRFYLCLGMLLQTVLTTPLMITFFSFFQCQTNTDSVSVLMNYNTNQCSTVSYYINISISVIGIITFGIIILFNSIYLHDNRPISKLPWTSPCSAMPFTVLSIKLVLSFFYVFQFTGIYLDIKASVVLILTIILIIMRFFNTFSYNRLVFKFIVLFQGSFCFNSLFSLINKYLLTVFSIQAVILQFITSLIFGYLLVNIMNNIEEHYLHKNVYTININIFSSVLLRARQLRITKCLCY